MSNLGKFIDKYEWIDIERQADRQRDWDWDTDTDTERQRELYSLPHKLKVNNKENTNIKSGEK